MIHVTYLPITVRITRLWNKPEWHGWNWLLPNHNSQDELYTASDSDSHSVVNESLGMLYRQDNHVVMIIASRGNYTK